MSAIPIFQKTLYHGRPARPNPAASSRQNGVFLSEEPLIAEAYAGPGGIVIARRIRESSKALDASATFENSDWHTPGVEEWARLLATANKHGIDVASSVNYETGPGRPIAWEALLDPFDGLGFDRRLSDVVRELGYDIILTMDYTVCVMGDIYKRFGTEAVKRLTPALHGRDAVPVVIALADAALIEIE
jgi:hypothetical protein